jgi:hypothetical protein
MFADLWRCGAVFSLSNAGYKSNVSLHGEKFARGRDNVDPNSIPHPRLYDLE